MTRRTTLGLIGALVTLVLATGAACASDEVPAVAGSSSPSPSPSPSPSASVSRLASTAPQPASAAPSAAPSASVVPGPLTGRVIVLDPGHQLGNSRFPSQINRPVPAGGFTKPCNTTGTATNSGYDEATFTWGVSQRLKKRLRALGARVQLTRHSNSVDRWGPCVNARGLAGNKLGADLKISVHGDGSYAAGARGFHVIYAPDRAPWTDDTYVASRTLALDTLTALRAAGFSPANYIAGGDGLDVRSDLGTLNLSDVPTVMVELGNMRSSADAARMTSAAGQAAYADALTVAARTFLE